MAKSVEVFVTGHSHSARRTLEYINGSQRTKDGTIVHNVAHKNANGVTKRNYLVAGVDCRTGSVRQTLHDFNRVLKKKTNNKVQTCNIVMSFGKSFDWDKPEDRYEAYTLARKFTKRAFPHHQAVIAEQQDNQNKMAHIHIIVNAISEKAPYYTIPGGHSTKWYRNHPNAPHISYNIRHLRRVTRDCIKSMNPKYDKHNMHYEGLTHQAGQLALTGANRTDRKHNPNINLKGYFHLNKYPSYVYYQTKRILKNPEIDTKEKFRKSMLNSYIRVSFKRPHQSRRRRRGRRKIRRRSRYSRGGIVFRVDSKNGKLTFVHRGLKRPKGVQRHYIKSSILSRIDNSVSYKNIINKLNENRSELTRQRTIENQRKHADEVRQQHADEAMASADSINMLDNQLENDYSEGLSVSSSASQSLSVSKSASKSVSASMSVSNSQSASLSLSASYSASTSTSQSQAKFVSAERSVSAVLSSSASASRASSASYSASISQSASLSASTSASYSASVSMSNASMSASSALSASSVAQSDYDSVKELGFNDKIDTMNRLANMDTENDRHISVWNYHNAVPVLASGTRDKEVLKPIRKSYRKMDTRKDRNSLHTAVDSLLHTFKSDICIGYHRLESVYQGVKAYCNANKYEVPNTQYDKWSDPVYCTKNATLERFKKYAKLSSLKVWGFGGKVKKLTKQSHMLNIVYKFSSKVSHAVDKGISPVYSHFDKVRKEKVLQKQLKADLVEDKKIQRSKAQSNAVQASMARSVDEQATLNHDHSVESSEALNRISRANHKQHREKVAYYKKHPKEFQKHEKEVARQRKSAIQRSRNNNDGPEMS